MALGIGDIIRTTVNFTLVGGDQYQNVYHHYCDMVGGWSDSAVVDEIELWVEAMYGEIVSSMKQLTVPTLCFVDQIEWVTDQWEVVANIGTFTPTVTAVSTADICPQQCSMFITFKTARPKTVGRKFLFAPLEGEQNNGVLDAGLVTKLVAFADDAVNDITLDITNILIPGVPRTAVNGFEEFQVAVVTNLVGTQRRRRQGYGA